MTAPTPRYHHATVADLDRCPHGRRDSDIARTQARWWMAVLALVTFLAGIGWPLALPIYLAVRKGMFVDQTLQTRQERTHG